MSVLDKIESKKEMTWTSQVRYEPEVLAELAIYFRNKGQLVSTKSMLVAGALRLLRDILYDNGLLKERVLGPDEALSTFTRLGFQLPTNRRALFRIQKSLQIEEERYLPTTPMNAKVQEVQRQLKAAGMEVTPDAATPEELDEQQKAKDIEYLNKQQELGSRPNGKEEA